MCRSLRRVPDSGTRVAERRATRRRWADLIRRIYEVDPLVCSNCSGQMKIVAFITDRKAIRAILASMRKSAGPLEQARAAQMGLFSPTVEVYRRTLELRARFGSAALARRLGRFRSWRGDRGT